MDASNWSYTYERVQTASGPISGAAAVTVRSGGRAATVRDRPRRRRDCPRGNERSTRIRGRLLFLHAERQAVAQVPQGGRVGACAAKRSEAEFCGAGSMEGLGGRPLGGPPMAGRPTARPVPSRNMVPGRTPRARWLKGGFVRVGFVEVRVAPLDLLPQWMPRSWDVEVTAAGCGASMSPPSTPATSARAQSVRGDLAVAARRTRSPGGAACTPGRKSRTGEALGALPPGNGQGAIPWLSTDRP